MNQINKDTLDLVKSFEGLFLKGYQGKADKPGLFTIGYGTIKYPPYFQNGRSVQLGDTITEKQAEDFLLYEIQEKSKGISSLVTTPINDNQFGALASFAYNLGLGNLKISTLLKRVNSNPSDPTIRSAFGMWTTANGVKNVPGLIRRRAAEADLYFKTI